MAGKFEITRAKNNEFYFRLKAGNGQIILNSEGYKTRSACDNGIASVIKNSADDKRFERNTAKNGKAFFNLLAINGQIIGTSQMYVSKSSCENGISSVATNAPDASVTDLS